MCTSLDDCQFLIFVDVIWQDMSSPVIYSARLHPRLITLLLLFLRRSGHWPTFPAIKFTSPLTSSSDPIFPVPCRTLPPSFGPSLPGTIINTQSAPPSAQRQTMARYSLNLCKISQPRGCVLLAAHPPTPCTRVEDRRYMCM